MGWESNNVFQVLIVTGGASSGVFMYTPSPGAGNLIASIVPVSGTDLYGNATLGGGFAAYDPTNGLATQITGDGPAFYTAPSEAGPWTLRSSIGFDGSGDLTLVPTGAGQVKALALLLAQAGATVNGGPLIVCEAAAAGLVVQVTDTTSAPTNPISSIIANAAGDNSLGIKVAGDTNYRLRVNSDGAIKIGPGSATQDTTLSRTIANMFLMSGSLELTGIAAPAAQANPVIYGDSTTGQLSEVNPQGLAGSLELAKSSTASHTVTQASLTQISAQFTIPAGDAVAGSTYRLEASGTGTWGSTVQNLTFQTLLAGSAFGDAAGVNSGTFPASTAVRWDLEATLTVATTGAAGTATQTLTVWISDNAIATNVSRLVTRHSAGNAINTTVSNTISMGAQWNATTGAPTATCDQTVFERVV